MPDIDAVSTVFSVRTVLTPFDTGALGRTTELVVSLDGICKASTLDVDEQPARQSDANRKPTTPEIRIFDLYAKQNRPKAGTAPPDNQAIPNEKLPTKFESKFTFGPIGAFAIRVCPCRLARPNSTKCRRRPAFTALDSSGAQRLRQGQSVRSR